MRKEKSEFSSITSEEELDLRHQGSIGGEQLVGKRRRNLGESEISISSGREPAEGPDVAITSPSHKRQEQQTFQRTSAKGPDAAEEQETEKSSKKHHYK